VRWRWFRLPGRAGVTLSSSFNQRRIGGIKPKDLKTMSGYTDKRPANKPPIENQPARGGEFGEGTHTGAGAIKSREIFRKGVTPVPEKPAPIADDFGGYGRKF
jgi:hypothetical protein